MDKFLDKLLENLSQGNVLLASVIAIVVILFNFGKIIEFINDQKKSKIAKLGEALKSEYISGLTKTHLQEALATEHFKMATGVRLEKEVREALINTHQNTQGALRFVHFKRAIPHIVYQDKKLFVKITRPDLIGYWINIISGFSLIILGILLIALNTLTEEKTLFNYGFGSFFILAAPPILFDTRSVISARMVAKELAKQGE